MSVPTAPPVRRVDQTLSFTARSGDTRTLDLATRALVVAVVPNPRWGREAEVLAGVAAARVAGADIAEVPTDPLLLGPAAAQGDLPIAARVTTAEQSRVASSAGAAVLLTPHGALDSWSDGGQLVVLVDSARAGRDELDAEAGRPVALDVTGRSGADAVAEESLALAVGVRLVRTTDVRRTRRVVEVMAHLLEARR